MTLSYKPKSIEVISFDNHNYDFLKKFRRDLIISIPLIHAQEINYVVDANGNLVTGDSFYREYNELNQLVRVRLGNLSTSPILEEYIWHPVEERVLVKDVFSNGILNYSIYYVNKNYIHIENSSGNYSEKYVYQDGTLVAQVTTDGQKQFVHSDHEGSVNLVTDIDGNVVENTLYSTYGEILSGGTASRFDSEGKEFDSLTNRLDFHFRQIDPRIPVWDKPDTLIQNVYDPQSLNRYMFERANPYRYTDKEGHKIGELIDLILTFIGFRDNADTISEKNPQVQEVKAESELVGATSGFLIFIGLASVGVAAGPAFAIGGVSAIVVGYFHEKQKIKQLAELNNNLKPNENLPSTDNELKCTVLWCPSKLKYESPSQQIPSQQVSNLNNRVTSTATTLGRLEYSTQYFNYVTNEGRNYPTTNPYWRPGCNLGCSIEGGGAIGGGGSDFVQRPDGKWECITCD